MKKETKEFINGMKFAPIVILAIVFISLVGYGLFKLFTSSLMMKNIFIGMAVEFIIITWTAMIGFDNPEGPGSPYSAGVAFIVLNSIFVASEIYYFLG